MNETSPPVNRALGLDAAAALLAAAEDEALLVSAVIRLTRNAYMLVVAECKVACPLPNPEGYRYSWHPRYYPDGRGPAYDGLQSYRFETREQARAFLATGEDAGLTAAERNAAREAEEARRMQGKQPQPVIHRGGVITYEPGYTGGGMKRVPREQDAVYPITGRTL